LIDKDFLAAVLKRFSVYASLPGMEPGPIPTLGELQRVTPWVWLWCESCQHHEPLAYAVAAIRWGADVSSNRPRQRARCTSCGNKGATIQHPGWVGNDVGFLPFPVS